MVGIPFGIRDPHRSLAAVRYLNENGVEAA